MSLATLSTPGLLACPPRWATPRCPDRLTLGGKVAEVAAALGKPLMPWQRYVADVALETDPGTGQLVYREVVVHVMRQQGKTTLQLPVLTHRCVGFGTAQHATYAAQSGVAARQKLLDEHAPMLLASPLGRLATVRRQSGHEAILWRNGSRHTITAATEKAGHGTTLDLAVIDEAFAYTDARLEQAFVPAMQTRPQPQLWVMSTAGTDASTYLRAKVDSGRARAESGLTDLVAYFEWSFADDDDPGDPATWRARMPAMGHTVTERAVAAARASMEDREFLRAFGNRWVPRTVIETVIDPLTWAGLEDSESVPSDPLVFAVDVSPDRAWTSIAVAGRRPDGCTHVELTARGRGTGWAVDRLADMAQDWSAPMVVLDPAGPAGGLVAALEERAVKVTPVSGRELAQACGSFFDAVMERRLRHTAQPPLNEAVLASRRRPMGDAWAWARKDATSDISPLVAVTLAAHGLQALADQPAEPWGFFD